MTEAEELRERCVQYALEICQNMFTAGYRANYKELLVEQTAKALFDFIAEPAIAGAKIVSSGIIHGPGEFVIRPEDRSVVINFSG